jgi:hypothetical protein
MAFALTDATFYKIDIPSAVKKRGLQGLEFKVTRGASDTDLDIGNISGTFWTAAIADGTYGTQSALALKEFTKIASAIDGVVSCEVLGAAGMLLRVASASANTQYTLVGSGTYPLVVPEITLYNDAAPATVSVRLVVSLTDETNTVDFAF